MDDISQSYFQSQRADIRASNTWLVLSRLLFDQFNLLFREGRILYGII